MSTSFFYFLHLFLDYKLTYTALEYYSNSKWCFAQTLNSALFKH